MRIPSPANQLGRIAAQEAAGSAAAAKPNATAAQTAQTAANASPLQARPSRLGVQQQLQQLQQQPRRQQIAKLAAELMKQGLPGGLQPRPQIQSASQLMAQAHAAGTLGASMLAQARPQIQSAAQALGTGQPLPERPSAQAPVATAPQGAGARPEASALFQSLLPGGPTFTPTPHAPMHHAPMPHAAAPAPDASALFQSLLPGGPTFAPTPHAPMHHAPMPHAAGPAPDASALFQSLLPGGPTFAPPSHPSVRPQVASGLEGLLVGQPAFTPVAQVVHQQHVHSDLQSFVDPFKDQRLQADPPPATARFQKTTAMMASYDKEDTGKVWGTKVAYLDEQQRQQYKLTVQDGKIYNAKGELFDTASAATVLGGGKAIFVMDHDGNMYASTSHAVGKFHHSSFLAGQPVAAAGEIEVHNGQVTVVNRKSGHYRPTESQLNQVAEHLSSLGVSNFSLDQKV